jgi:hypothetical protein
MIRNESEYREAVERITQERQRFAQHRQALLAQGLTDEQAGRAIEPLISFHLQLVEEVEGYERLKRGEFEELRNFEGLGRVLVGLRIAMGLTQRELAERLDVHESQVSRDERNDYHGVTIERVQRILNALNVTFRTSVEPPKPDPSRELVGV